MSDNKPPPLSPHHRKVLSKFQTVPVAPLTEARRLFQRGRITESDDIVLKILQASPDHPGTLHLGGLIALQQGETQRAVDYFASAIQAETTINPEFHASLGLALKLASELEPALRAHDKALSVDTNNPGTWNERGNVLVLMGRMEEAQTCYQKSLELAPRTPGTWANLGTVQLSLGKFDAAITSFEQAIKLNPKMAQDLEAAYGEAKTKLDI